MNECMHTCCYTHCTFDDNYGKAKKNLAETLYYNQKIEKKKRYLMHAKDYRNRMTLILFSLFGNNLLF